MIPNTTIYFIPVVVIFFLLELLYSYIEDKHLYAKRDTLNNIAIGAGTFITQALSKILVFYAFQFAFRFHMIIIGETWWAWILVLLGSEFTFYWFHRASHEINWFWASHVVHHSSDEYNLTVAIRLPWFPQLTGKFLFWIWMPILGFHPIMILLVMQMQDFYQGFLHTKTVNKLPRFFEYIFNTPSHHRVHHSSNFEYLDKNHGGVLILFDRIFGTYAEETVAPVYGITSPSHANNIGSIMFHEWTDLFKKAFKAGSFKNAINYFIQAPGWSHDGSSKTVKQMRKLNPVPGVVRPEKNQYRLLFFQPKKMIPAFKTLFVVLLALICQLTLKGQENWSLKKDKNGIKIFTRKTDSSNIEELKVECAMEGSMSQFAAVILDMKGHTEWVYKSSKCYLIKQNTPTDLFFYNETECPWPLTNRDLVAHMVLSQDPKNKTMIIEVRNVDGYMPVQKDIVRTKHSFVRWKIVPIDNKKLQIEYTIQVDPAGSIPSWIINLFATKGPYETFMKLKEVVKRPEYQKNKPSFILD